MRDSWSDPDPAPRGQVPRGQGFDRLVSAGRQLVDGVSGARPGSRPPARGAGRGAAQLPRLNELGRWVENKLDWILEDEEDWREPWQEPPAPAASPDEPTVPSSPRPSGGRRRPLEAISRRNRPAGPSRPLPLDPPPDDRIADGAADDAWPEPDSFSLPRWQRPVTGRTSPPPSSSPGPATGGGRPVPRSSRRRPS